MLSKQSIFLSYSTINNNFERHQYAGSVNGISLCSQFSQTAQTGDTARRTKTQSNIWEKYLDRLCASCHASDALVFEPPAVLSQIVHLPLFCLEAHSLHTVDGESSCSEARMPTSRGHHMDHLNWSYKPISDFFFTMFHNSYIPA